MKRFFMIPAASTPIERSLARLIVKYTDYFFITTFEFIVIRRELCDHVLSSKEGSRSTQKSQSALSKK